MVGTDLGRKIVVVLVVAVVVVLVAYLLFIRPAVRREEVPVGVQEVPGETRSVTLYFAAKDADGLLPETREIAVAEGLEAQVRAAVTELARGPLGDDAVSAIPIGTELLQVFWGEETQTLYLDFNRALITNHPGGSTAEYYTITTILRTIAENFPQTRRVQFLVAGYPVETIAGHYAVDEPIDILNWK